MEKILIITSCSAKKRDYKTKASDLYQGQLFKLAKKFARINNFDFKIISAKYGLIEPDLFIEPYDQTISNKRDVLLLQKLMFQKFKRLTQEYDIVLIIMGLKYREIINKKDFKNVFYIVDKRGIGGYKNLLKNLINTNFSKIIKVLKEKDNHELTLGDIKMRENRKFHSFDKIY